ncbi:AraC family transcriptional regulator [Sorangium sp. So ce1389]|uniref:AraC family transcriptional regulator n=1 Tax=Sorangium sp. So ce1389 TaxID=3133336 RepID=UPI003F61FA2E
MALPPNDVIMRLRGWTCHNEDATILYGSYMKHPGDPIEGVLALLRTETVLSARIDARGPWALRFDASPHVKFGTIARGRVFVSFERKRPQVLEVGDVYVLCNAPSYLVASDLDAPVRPAEALFRRAPGETLRIGPKRGVAEVQLIGGYFNFDPQHAHWVTSVLPPLLRIPATAAGAAHELARLLVREVGEDQAARGFVLDRLAQLILVSILRSLDRTKLRKRVGWIAALADPHIGVALRCIHRDPASSIVVGELARAAGMSRTAFAARFKALVGRPAYDYAIAWRMSLARDALVRDPARSIGQIAFDLGYKSESAFSTAFRREVGMAPRAYRAAASMRA